MTATAQRDRAGNLAKSDPRKALEVAQRIDEPWYRAQALAWVARYTDGDPVGVARQAAKSARECNDDYQRSAVRAWEIAALAERGYLQEAKQALSEAVELAHSATPVASRSEALFLLLQAALTIDPRSAAKVGETLASTCQPDHWRAKRALRDAHLLLAGELPPRKFFHE